MFYLVEIVIAFVITYAFIKREKPKLKFLFYGYIFFLLALILQIPFKFLQAYFEQYLTTTITKTVLLSVISIIVTEFVRYFSLKRYLKTKSYKNGILFGIGWATFDAINYIKIIFFTSLFSLLPIYLDYSTFLSSNLPFITFSYSFVLNVALTTLCIIAIIKKRIFYVIYAILINIISFSLIYFDSLTRLIIEGTIFAYCLFVIFHYRKIK